MAKPTTPAAVAAPSVFTRLAPRASLWLAVARALCCGIASIVRAAWPYRRELAAATVVFTTWRIATDLIGHPGLALVLVAVVTAALVLHPRTGRIVRGWLRASHTRRQLIAGMQALRVANADGKLPWVRSARPTPVGERMVLDCQPGQSAELLDMRVLELRAATKARDTRVTRDPAKSNLVVVDVIRRDPFADGRALPWADAEAEVLSLWDPVHFGTDENGQRVELSLVERGLFVGGEPGSGKSSILNVVLSHAAKSPDAHLVLIDPNEVQFGPWKDRALAFADDDPKDAENALQVVRAEIHRRKKLLRSLPGVNRKVTRTIAKDHGLALVLVAIDELAYHTSVIGTPNGPFAKYARDIVARGRAFGIIPVFATQRPTSDVVPTSLRDLFSLRYALRTTTQASSDVILGEGWARRGYSATDIDITTRGVGWLLAEGQVPRKTKNPWVDDTLIANLSVTTVRHRPDPLPASEPEPAPESEPDTTP